jgi:hypothetical protein
MKAKTAVLKLDPSAVCERIYAAQPARELGLKQMPRDSLIKWRRYYRRRASNESAQAMLDALEELLERNENLLTFPPQRRSPFHGMYGVLAGRPVAQRIAIASTPAAAWSQALAALRQRRKVARN